MAEAERKRQLALGAARAEGFDAVVVSAPASVRWLLCGRGRPVDAAAPESPYTVVVAEGGAAVLFPDIEAPRVASEERLDELGYEPVPYPWHEGPERALAGVLNGEARLSGGSAEAALAPLRRSLVEEERERYRAAGAAAAEAVTATLERLAPGLREREAAAILAGEARLRGLFPAVVLVAGARRQLIHRHPLPTDELLGEHALLALTAEREGLHVSLTRLVSFGPPPARLAELVRLAAEVDATMLLASTPGTELGTVLRRAAAAYARAGFPTEWRRHHQGGLTGYRGREVFAVPDEPATVPPLGAVAWNPSITGGAKSEDTALVSAEGVEVLTRTPSLPELALDGLLRPDVVVL